MKKFYLLVFCMFFMIISCEKEGIVIDNKEPEIDHFLEVGYIEGVNKFILEQLRERDRKVKTEKLVKLFKKHKKVREDIEKIGYVSWKNLIRWQGEDDDNMLIVIPIIKENSTLCEGFALVSYLPNDHLRYGFVSRAQIPSLPKEEDLPLNSVYSQEFAIMLISLCDTELFGGADCNLVRGLPQLGEKTQLQQRTEHCSVYIDLSNCVCSNGGYAVQGSGCNYWVCSGSPLVVYCPISTYPGGTGGGTGGSTGGGTGGSTGGGSGGGSNNEEIEDFYTFEEITRICPESIILKKVGNSYYACIKDIFPLFDTRGGDGVTLTLTYCISIPEFYGSNYAKDIIAFNFSEAKQTAASLASQLRGSGVKYTGSKVRSDINTFFSEYLRDWVPSASIIPQACEGAIPCFYVEKDC